MDELRLWAVKIHVLSTIPHFLAKMQQEGLHLECYSKSQLIWFHINQNASYFPYNATRTLL